VHGIDEKSRESRSRNFQADSYKFQKDCGCSNVPCSILPQNVSKKEENRKKQSKMSQSCAKVALRGKNCALARKRESCTAQHRNFLGGLKGADSGLKQPLNCRSSSKKKK